MGKEKYNLIAEDKATGKIDIYKLVSKEIADRVLTYVQWLFNDVYDFQVTEDTTISAVDNIFNKLGERLIYFFINDKSNKVDIWFDKDDNPVEIDLSLEDINIVLKKYAEFATPGDDYYNRKIVITFNAFRKLFLKDKYEA